MKAAPRDISWQWDDALRGALFTTPAAVTIATGHVQTGLACAIGVLPAAIIGLLPTVRERSRVVIIGLLFAIFIIFGSLLAPFAWLAVGGIFLLALAAAQLAAYRSVGTLAMTLCLPLAAIGLSFDGLAVTVGFGFIIIAGSIFAYGITLFWPKFESLKKASPALLENAGSYGIRLGLAAATAAAIGYGLDFDHKGWATAAALFVMRPQKEMQELRSIGRVAAVFLGALAAITFLHFQPPDSVLALAALLAISAAGATHTSRWYITPLFTTFIVIQMLLYSDPGSMAAWGRFSERVGETILGVSLAYLFGLLLPRLMASARRRSL